MDNSQERRHIPWLITPVDIVGLLAILYTVGYLAMVGALFFIEIPVSNKEPLLQLFGLMSAIQMALIQFYFGSSKGAENSRTALENSKGKVDEVLQSVVKSSVVNSKTNGDPHP